MGLAEGQALADEVVGEVGGEEEGIASGGGASGGVNLDAFERAGEDGEAEDELVVGVEDGRLVLLEVAVVGEREAFDEGEESLKVALKAGGFAAEEFERVRVFLVGHEARAGGEGVGQGDEFEFGGAPEDEVLGDAGGVDAAEGGGGKEFDEDVAVGDGIEAVLGETRLAGGVHEAEGAGGELAVNGEGGAGESAGAEGAPVGAVGDDGEALAVAPEHFDVGEEVMGEGDGLGAL